MASIKYMLPKIKKPKTKRELQNELLLLETEKVDLLKKHNDEYREVVGQFQQYVLDQSNIRRLSLDVINEDTAGEVNAYKDYDTQVEAARNKYNSVVDLGGALVRSIVDLRTAFISGEEIAISSDNTSFVDWAEDFLKKNSFQSEVFIPAVKSAELTGHMLLVLDLAKDNERRKDRDDPMVKIKKIQYTRNIKYKQEYSGDYNENFEGLKIKGPNKLDYGDLSYNYYVYIRTGGDDLPESCPTSRVGNVLQYIDNYDRCLKDIRLTNHITARITPCFQTDDAQYAAKLQDDLIQKGWKIGDVVVGNVEFKYATSNTGPLDSLTNELVALIKSITSVTGIPVHWLGYTEILSNRSTAETLYDLIKNATINDRSKWQDALYDLILQAQEVYIEAGGDKITEVDKNFKVTIPLIDFASFKERVEALSNAYKDYAISLQTYRANLPGVDPTKEARFIDEELADEESDLRLRLDRTVKTILEEENKNNGNGTGNGTAA